MVAFGDTTTLTGKSGAQYEFSIFPRFTRFKPNAGVYVMGRGQGADQYAFCFVGHARDLSVRPLNAAKTECFGAFGVDHIFILEEPNETRRAQIADDLIQAYTPRCNTI
ncbi:MAG TPA: hypothetical protein VEA80_20180 [Vitreimonas sp.]|uniref:hypothetical protein n=1 Tax=Vitreimonas sp. TaxID=3069702 RepID=UPI002D436E7A|nr:hypothetical protein [Vitreimonas sp.]HYD89809.1 hypothetical protein [Vitreimonas sp.]